MSMRIATSEGGRHRFEVVETIDGYTVHMTALDAEEMAEALKRFRTAPAAFAFAEMVASLDRVKAARGVGQVDVEAVLEHHASAQRFDALREALSDDGVPATLLDAWDKAEAAAARRHYH